MGQLSVFILLSVLCGLTDCFWRRRYHSSVLAGNWIYIDGGDIMNQNGTYFRNNETNGLDLSKNWSNTSLALTRTERPVNAMPLSGQALWFDEKRNLIYCFGGFRTWSLNSYDPTPFESIWAFTPDEKGTGSWKEVLGPSAGIFPSGIIRPFNGGFCSDDSYGYYVGGYVNSQSTPSLDNKTAVISHGLLKFDFGDLKITNTSDGDYGRSQSFQVIGGTGKVVNVPTYGAGGIVILLGEGDPKHVISFNNITIYDKTEQNWYSQLASGDVPEPRSDFCIVGIQGTTGSGNFEIFMYGGVINYKLGPGAANSDQVYILSLPAFHWFEAIYPQGFSRALHTCHATNTNQMIILGGVDPSKDTRFTGWADNGDEPVDPWPEGIGIFDMTALKFKDSYEAGAKRYETPESIRRFYNDKSNKYPTWNSPAVGELFQPRSNQTSNATDSEYHAPVNQSIANSTNPPRLSSGSIAGIAIGVATPILTLFAIAILIKKRTAGKAKLKVKILKRELPADNRHELTASAKHPELADEDGWRTELANTGVLELFDTSRRDRVELP